MLGTVVVGAIFTDIKGFSSASYRPKERNLGRVEFVHGGVCRNIAEDIASSGMPVTFVSLTEESSLGVEVVSRLNDCGVNTEFILPVKENGIGKWLVILDQNGDVSAQLSCPPDLKPLAAFIDSYGDDFVKSAENIILEMDIGEEITEKILTLAEKYNKPVYPIVGNMSVLLKRTDYIRRTDCFVYNELEFGRVFQCDTSEFSPAQMLSFVKEQTNLHSYPSTIVTMGDRGCVFWDRKTGEEGWIPAISTRVVDTTGAGDAFLAGTVMGLSKGLGLRRAAELGTSIASLTIQSEESACPQNQIPNSFLPDGKGKAVCLAAMK